jgi:hypothetical protein
MLIPDERAEKALRFLAETDMSCAEAKADMERAEYKAKATKQAVFQVSAGNVAERTAAAETSDDYRQAMDAYFSALRDYSYLANKRETERIVMDAWRTTQANRRQGQ